MNAVVLPLFCVLRETLRQAFARAAQHPFEALLCRNLARLLEWNSGDLVPQRDGESAGNVEGTRLVMLFGPLIEIDQAFVFDPASA